MSNAGAPDSSIVERLKNFVTEYGTELLKPCHPTEELLRKLDRLEYVLLHTLQEHKKFVEMFLQPSKEALIADELVRHSEFDVRVSAASCISQIIRITAPDESYEEGHMKEFFLLANSAFEILSCMSGRAYSKAVPILHTMSNTQSCVLILDLELYATVGHIMFHLILDGIRTSYPSEVFSSMEKFMMVIICNTVDNDEFLLVLVKILLNSLRRENQKVSPVSFQLAENTFQNCSGDLKAYRSEALTCLDVPIEDYAEVVVSFFYDATQRENTVVPVEESREKTTVSEGLNEDIMNSSPQCRLLHSKDEAPSGRVFKHNPTESLSHLRKSTISNWGRGAVGIILKTSWSSSIRHMIPPLEFTKRNMSNAGAPDSSIVEQLKKLLTKYGTELLKPCDSTEELLRKLDRLEHVLVHTLQEYKKLVEMLLQPAKEALIANELIRHSELDVRVSVASCISQIIRITAPDEPYEEDQMKEFFLLANSAFEMLSFMSGRAYSKAVSILHTMSNTQSCVMMLDLEMYATIGHMFHVFLDGIRTSHPSEVFSSMEKFMTVIILNTVDNDEFLMVLVKILLNSLRREYQKLSPVSFQLAENIFKNCSGDLEIYRSEAITCLDFPIEDYAEVVISFFQDAAQRENKDLKDTEDCVSCLGEAGLAAIEPDLAVGSETQNPDKLDKSMLMQQEQKPEEIQNQRKRNRRPNSLKKAEEGYDPFWMLTDRESLENPSKKNKKDNNKRPVKTQILKDLSPKPTGTSISLKPSKKKKDAERNEGMLGNQALEPNNKGKMSEDQTRDIPVKDHSENGLGSSTKVAPAEESRGKTTVSEGRNEDIMTSSSQGRPRCSKDEAPAGRVSKQYTKETLSNLRKRCASKVVGKEVVGRRIKIWWPLDKKFYGGKILCFDDKYKLHQIDYDDGEMEFLDLRGECWKLLKDGNSPAHKQDWFGTAPASSSGTK